MNPKPPLRSFSYSNTAKPKPIPQVKSPAPRDDRPNNSTSTLFDERKPSLEPRDTTMTPMTPKVPTKPAHHPPKLTTLQVVGPKTVPTANAATLEPPAIPESATKRLATAKSTTTVAETVKSAPRLSALDAAAEVLSASDEPLSCPELIEAMMVRKLWISENGKTPAATLHSAIMREINTKGATSRFVKVGRGKFARRPKT